MLTELCITNFALIDQHTIAFKAGMSVLTGETGAGKSIIIDALSLVLGERADSQFIRHGTQRCEITARFELDDSPAAQRWLTQQNMTVDDDCLVRRVLTSDGKSRAYINGQAVPLQQLRQLGECLVNIHGQHEHQSLLKTQVQRDLVDQYGNHQALLLELKGHYQAWLATQQRLSAVRNNLEQQGRREFIEFQLAEWTQLALSGDDISALENEHKQLATMGDRLIKVQASVDLLTNESQSLESLLQQARTYLSSIKDLHPTLNNAFSSLESASIQIDEATHDLQHYLRDTELNPARLTQIEAILQMIYQLARKHRIKPLELAAFFLRLEEELQALTVSLETLNELEHSLVALHSAYQDTAQQLTQARMHTICRLAAEITTRMQHLGMTGGRFDIVLEPHENPSPTANGNEQLEFRVSANPGQPLQALAKVASGGELSRISLAIQVILAGLGTCATLIFDEVDVGIGGPTAAIVGQLLRELSAASQVLCVTHLPQVAACGTHHYQIAKHTDLDQTTTTIYPLTPPLREQEIARMLGGISVTEQSLAHARELLK